MVTGTKSPNVLTHVTHSDVDAFALKMGVAPERINKIQDFVIKAAIDCEDTGDLILKSMAIGENESERIMAAFFAGNVNIINSYPQISLAIENSRNDLGDLSATM